MPNVAVVFNADTGQFVSNVDGMDKAVAKASEQVAKAKNAILQFGQQSVQAAKDAGASSERLASIQERTAQRLASVTEQNANRQLNALDRLQAKARAVAAEMSNLNKVVDISSAHGNDFTQRQQSAAVLRAFSGRSSLRTGEAFASAIPGFAAFSESVFPVAGAIAFGTVIAEGVSHLKEMYDTAKKLPQAITDGFDALNAPILLSVDSTRKENDQLAAAIAKIEHKPANNLAIALDDARIYADKLAESANHATDQVAKLFKENHAGFFAGIFGGQDTTGPAEDEINQRMQAIRDLERANRDALHAPGADPGSDAAKQRIEGIRQAYQSLYDLATTRRKQYAEGGKGEQSNVNIYAGAQDYASYSLDQLDADQKHVQLQGRFDTDKAGKDLASQTNKAKEQQLKALDNYVNVWKTQAPVSAKAIYDFWQAQLAAFKGAPEQLDAINAKLAELATEGANKAHEAVQKWKDEQKKNNTELFSPHVLNVEGNTADSGRQLTAESTRVAQANTQMQAEYAKTKVQIDLASGSISKLTADERLAAIAAQEHADKLAGLKDQLAEFQAGAKSFNPLLGLYTDNKEQQQYIALTGAIAKEAAQQSIDAMKDAANIAADTWQTALNHAFDGWVQHATDTAAQVTGLFKQSIDGVNDDLVNLISGQYKRGDFKRTGQQLFKTGAGDILQHTEGSIAKAFGLGGKGKPDGTKSNPLFVSVVGSSSLSGGAPTGIFSGLKLPNVTPVGGDGSDGDDGQVSGFRKVLGGIFGSIAGIFGGARALGGGVSAGQIYRINESGQELFAPNVDGKMISHDQSMSMFGGGGRVYYHVEVANGVTPEQMDMKVRAALQEYHPHGVKAAVQAVHDHQRRVAPSAAR